MKYCGDCGTQLLESAKFCVKCGKEIEKPECPQCGYTIRSGVKFCPECGTMLVASEITAPQIQKQAGATNSAEQGDIDTQKALQNQNNLEQANTGIGGATLAAGAALGVGAVALNVVDGVDDGESPDNEQYTDDESENPIIELVGDVFEGVVEGFVRGVSGGQSFGSDEESPDDDSGGIIKGLVSGVVEGFVGALLSDNDDDK